MERTTRAPVAAGAGGIPDSIGGFPTVVDLVDPSGLAIEIVGVRDLESRLDRDRLLNDETYVPPYWALVWSGSIALARLLGGPVPCRGCRVLDVGCGLGLLSLVAAREGARVTAIDREPVPIDFLRASARRLGLSLRPLATDLETATWEAAFDLVLCAELLYERDRFGAMAAALDAALARGGRLVVADARRVDTSQFWNEMAARGFETSSLGTFEAREEGTLVRVSLSTSRRRGDGGVAAAGG